jgi:hypothetical protein
LKIGGSFPRNLEPIPIKRRIGLYSTKKEIALNYGLFLSKY